MDYRNLDLFQEESLAMDEELQRAIRDFRPEDPMTHGVWHKLMRVSSLSGILATVPLTDASLKTLFLLAGTTLKEISVRLEKQKPIRPNAAKYRGQSLLRVRTHPMVSISQDSADRVFLSLYVLMQKIGESLQVDCDSYLAPTLDGHGYSSGVSAGWDGDITVTSVDLGFEVEIARPETQEEADARHAAETAAQEAKKLAKRERAKQRKLELEQQELAQYQRLKKKFDKKLDKENK